MLLGKFFVAITHGRSLKSEFSWPSHMADFAVNRLELVLFVAMI